MKWLTTLLLTAFAFTSQAQDTFSPEEPTVISTSEIIDAALACEDCIDWQIVGICFWLRCTPAGCSIETSIKVSHRMPDFVVTAYTNSSPWEDYDILNDAPTAAMSNANHDRVADGYLDFKHVQVISNPAILIFKEIASNNEYFCDSTIDFPLLPYFISTYDYNWRNPLIENFYPQAWLGYPRISTDVPGGYWAKLYPRCGWGSHPFDPINAAAAAFRAADIVSKEDQPHIYQYAGDDCNPKCWPPGSDDHFFQMLAPVAETTATKFGGSAAWANGRAVFDERYAWNLWRRYSCCQPEGAFLFDIDFEDPDSGDN